MSLRWQHTLSLSRLKGAQKRKVTISPSKSVFLSKKVCYKVSLCENFQRQSCKAFTVLSNHAQMVGGDVPFYLKFWTKLTDPPPSKTTTSNRYLPNALQLCCWQLSHKQTLQQTFFERNTLLKENMVNLHFWAPFGGLGATCCSS